MPKHLLQQVSVKQKISVLNILLIITLLVASSVVMGSFMAAGIVGLTELSQSSPYKIIPPPFTNIIIGNINDLQVAPIKLKVNDIYEDNTLKKSYQDFTPLMTKITAAVERGNPDLIVTPEYTFYNSTGSNDSIAIIVDCPEGSSECAVSKWGKDSQIVLDAIGLIKLQAAISQTNFVIGTVAEFIEREGYSELTDDIIFNTQLIINHEGKIIGKKRKLTEWDASSDCRGYPTYDTPCYLKAYELALETVNKWELLSHKNKTFTIFPIICGERNNEDMLNKAKDFNVDLIVNSEREGDANYETITKNIQNGVDPGSGWDWMIEDIFIEKYINQRNVVKKDGWLVTAEGSKKSGIINFQQKKLKLLDITDDYVYGIFKKPSDLPLD